MKRILLALLFSLAAGSALADQITLLATMGNKAVISVNGARKTLGVGQQVGAVKLVRLDGDGAVFEVDGKQRRLALGEGYVGGNDTASTGGSVILSPDARGHFFTSLTINGRTVSGVVDTGATHLSMNSKQAKEMGIDYTKGQSAMAQTANGSVKAWLLWLPQVKVGTIVVYDVPVGVRDGTEEAPVLIGTSLLNRFQMKREQDAMILTKKLY
ncbi:retropepsin-like aspartic protease family protein [Chitiniphilus eburneus]|uniref:TIGR02281 family clan AA aspartic protease n=1 Tax=Chitiniphilus eburneus TaxID=2571148 RepID=A0A4U0PU98_9NEIS|nr:TIGR02281 family clan AA aspartic protease [Chitiniphilus eburneus]TJZ72036.1 TIGR02281 family clan AA aspartic protease [Chitiniphilus eburneus]